MRFQGGSFEPRAVVVTGLIAALLGASMPAAAPANHGPPNINYVSLKKRAHGPPTEQYTLRIFTSYTHPHAGHGVSASYKGERADAKYDGPNRAFDEWRISARSKRSGKKLVLAMAKRVRADRRVAFTAFLDVGATEPFLSRCVIKGFDELGGCRDVPAAQGPLAGIPQSSRQIVFGPSKVMSSESA